MDEKKLINMAKEAAKLAYVPYSHYTVGAALLCKNGKVYTGCNIENAAYSPTNCAERTAFFNAVSKGERSFEAIAVVGGYELDFKDFFAPCGVCRQVMAEFCDETQFKIILGKNTDDYAVYTLKELLPVGFTSKSIPASLKEEET